MNLVQAHITLVLREDFSPHTLALYQACCDDRGHLNRAEFEREIYQRLEASESLEQQVALLQERLRIYQGHVDTLKHLVRQLRKTRNSVLLLQQEIDAINAAASTLDKPSASCVHAAPSGAIRAIKRLRHEQVSSDDDA